MPTKPALAAKSSKPKAPAAKQAVKQAAKSAAKPQASQSAKFAAALKPLTGKATVLKSKTAYTGRVFHVTTDTVTEPGGVTSTRDVIRHNGSVVILAVDSSKDPHDPSILIERQYRHAAGQFLLELPAGRIEPNEAPLAAAKRELIEETGYRAARWSRLIRYYASPGFLAETMQIFLAEDLRLGEAQPEPDEKITLTLMPMSELLTYIEEGKILDGKTILGVLFYYRKYFTA